MPPGRGIKLGLVCEAAHVSAEENGVQLDLLLLLPQCRYGQGQLQVSVDVADGGDVAAGSGVG